MELTSLACNRRLTLAARATRAQDWAGAEGSDPS